MMKRISILLMAMVPVALWAQFAPAQDKPGTTAMHADSSAFVAWATGIELERGPMNITNPGLGLASFGPDLTVALGKPGGTMDVVSLGDGGKATLTFDSPICNEPGPDFAVFENGFANAVDPETWALELGFVEVSSDGVNFFRFPAVTYVQTDTQLGNGGSINPAQLHNFASKYGAFYGTPFDLDEVEDNALLDKHKVTHVRIVDVVGNIDPEYATYDSEGHIVNDPWPTPFASSGMDLDAVGVIHDLAHFDVPENGGKLVSLYPNPVRDRLFVKTENLQSVEIYNAVGQLVMKTTEEAVDLSALTDGIYLVRVVCEDAMITQRIVKQ
jgi:hypothetical protein